MQVSAHLATGMGALFPSAPKMGRYGSLLEDGAGLWMRIDKGSQSVAFDNMQDRAIRGTTGW